MTQLTKRQLTALERLFAADIEAAESKLSYRRIVQSKANVYQELEHDGLCEFYVWQGFPVMGNAITIKGWVITQKGHLVYCENC